MTLNTTLQLRLTGKLSSTLDIGSRLATVLADWPVTLGDGAGALSANLIYQDSGNIAAAGTASLDLAGGALSDPFGAALTFARIKGLFVRARSTNNAANNVVVTRPAANGVPLFTAAGDSLALRAGEIFSWISPTASGVVVTAGTGDLIDLVNSAGTNAVDYDVVILGAST
jgi:hypothetical protein